MKVKTEYPRQEPRCLHFDADGKRVRQTSQKEPPAYDPWRALKQLQPDIHKFASDHS